MKPLRAPLLLLGLLFFAASSLRAQNNERNSLVEITGAAVQESPAQIALSWETPVVIDATTVESYAVSRRTVDFNASTLWSSSDAGSTWTPVAGAPGLDFYSIRYANGIWVAGGADGALYTSTDGATWTKKTLTYNNDINDNGGEYKTITGIANNGSTWIVTACRLYQASGTGTNVYISTDNAATFTSVLSHSTVWNLFVGNSRDVAYGNGRWIVAGGKNTPPAITTGTLENSPIFYSTTGANGSWTAVNFAPVVAGVDGSGATMYRIPYIYGLAHQGGTSNNWVVVGEKGDIYSSSNNGNSWTLRTSGTTKTLRSVTYASGLWVAVGESTSQTSDTAVILTSTNMTAWTARASGTGQSLNKVFHDGSKFIATGDGGVRLHSTDGATWTTQAAIGERPVSQIARNGDTWIAAFSQGWGTPLGAGLPLSPLTFTDTTVQTGKLYEYQVVRTQYVLSDLHLSGRQYSDVYGRTLAGINLPLAEDRGRVLLVVDTATAAALPAELDLYRQNLVGDGHEVVTLTVDPVDTNPVNNKNAAPALRAAIVAAWQQDPARTRAVILLGNVPYAYSGTIATDGHTDHRGAWVSDGYYGTPEGEWTDTVANLTAGSNALGNIPGDGYLDQNSLPAPLRLAVGRVRMDNLSLFPETPAALVKRYIEKNHAYRGNQFNYQARGLVGSGWVGNAFFAGVPWNSNRAFSALYGSQAQGGTTFTANGGTFGNLLANGSYLTSFATAAGTDTSCEGFALSAGFVGSAWQTAFLGLWGSYHADYYKANNVLRSALAQREHIVATYAGNSANDSIHPMGMGLSLGDVWRNWGGLFSREYAILGDPTLRLHRIAPPTAGSINASNQLSWTASADAPEGYYIYRSATKLGAYTRLTPSLVTGTTWTDPSPLPGTSYYQVRAIKKYGARTGTYWTNSQGLFLARSETAPTAPSGFAVSGVTDVAVNLVWTDNAANEAHFALERSADGGPFAPLALVPLDTQAFTDTTVAPGVAYAYRLAARNNAGASAWVATPSVTTAPLAPAALSATFTGSAINLAWTDRATNETGYEIARKVGASGAWQTFSVRPAGATALADYLVSLDQTYLYRVRALGATPSPWSDEFKIAPPWSFVEFGVPALPGDFNTDPQNFTLATNGNRIGGSSDLCTMLHRAAPAAGTLTVRLQSWSNTYNYLESQSRFGVMLRDGTAANARHFSLVAAVGTQGLAVTRRDTTNGGTTRYGAIATPALPNLWLRIVWGSGTATAFYSTDGSAWTQLHDPVAISAWSNLQIGLVGTSESFTRLVTATFTEVALTTPPPAGAPAAPGAIAVSGQTATGLTLSWSDNSADETGFKIERSLSPSGPFALVATTAANATSFTDTGLAAGVFYYYRVTATNASGDSAAVNAPAALTTPPASSAVVYEPFRYPVGGFTAAVNPGTGVTESPGPSATAQGLAGAWRMMKSTAVNLAGTQSIHDSLELADLARAGNHLAWSAGTSVGANYLFAPLATTATDALKLAAGETKTIWLSYILQINGLAGTSLVELRANDAANATGTPILAVGANLDSRLLNLYVNNTANQITVPYAFEDNKTYLLLARLTYSLSGTTTTFQSAGAWVLADLAALPASEAALGAPHVALSGTRSSTLDRTPAFLRLAVNNNAAASRFDEIRLAATYAQVAPVGAAAKFNLSGTVTLDGAGAGGVTVSAGVFTTTTAADGTYTLYDLPNGGYTLTASSPPNTFSPASIAITGQGVNLTGQNFAVIPPPPPAGPPSGFAATAATDSTLALSWTVAPDATTYQLERSATGAGGPWTVIAPAIPAATTTFTDTGLASATTYTYRIRANNLGGGSAYSPALAAATDTATAIIISHLSGWYRGQTTSSPPSTLTASGGDLVHFTGGSGTTQYAHFWRYFDPVALADGEALVLDVTFAWDAATTIPNLDRGLRFGLFNSNGSRLTTDIGGNNNLAHRDDTGYGVMFATGTNTTSRYTEELAAETANTPLSAGFVTLGADTGTATIADKDNHTLRFEIRRSGAQLLVRATLDGALFDGGRTVATPSTTTFDLVMLTNRFGNVTWRIRSLAVRKLAPTPVVTLTPVQSWRLAQFGTSEAIGAAADEADPDGDALANLLEYALGGNPLAPGDAVLPTAAPAAARLTLAFTPQAVAGLTYIVEASSDLVTWAPTDVTSLLTPGTPFTFTDSEDLATAPRRFLRLRVTAP